MLRKTLWEYRGKQSALVHLSPILAVILFFAASYLTYGRGWLPVGWDTPYYAGQTSRIMRQGVLPFLRESEYYNVGYSIVSSTLTTLGLSPLTVEIVLPIALAICLVLESGALVKGVLKDREIAAYATLFSACWFAVYRLSADLHANLLGLVFLLAASRFFLVNYGREKSTRVGWLWFSIITFLASFTHIETTIFFTFILLASLLQFCLLTPTKARLKRTLAGILLILLPALPGIILYVERVIHLLSYTQGTMLSNAQISPFFWAACLGPLIPLEILGFYLILGSNFTRKRNLEYNVFISSWALTSISFALAHYVLPGAQIFSERALILFPTPLLAATGVKAILWLRLNRSIDPLQFTHGRATSVCLVFALFISSTVITYTYTSPFYFKVNITDSAYEKLLWLSNNHRSKRSPIFLFNDYDQWAGGLGDMYNNWVEAIYGEHYSYLGHLHFFLATKETPFTSKVSQQISAIFLERMTKDGVFHASEPFRHEAILVTDFYLPSPLPKYYEDFLEEIHEGIYVLNTTKYKEPKSTRIPLYCSLKSSSEGWYSIRRNWAQSIHTLEFSSQKPSGESYCEFAVPIAEPGNYGLALRYWDGFGSEMALELNGELLDKIEYKGAGEPANFTIKTGFLPAGVHILRIKLQYETGRSQYASLDYLEAFECE